VEPRGLAADKALFGAAERYMLASGQGPDSFFFSHRGGREQAGGEFGELLGLYAASPGDDHPLWRESAAPDVLIEEVERIWSAIDQHDDWQPLAAKIAIIRELGQALGDAPIPAGHG
jgi:hypothetical protein